MEAPLPAGSAPTVDAALRLAAERFGEREAFVDGDERLTYGGWARAAAGVATVLAEAGGRPGAVVCLALPTSIDFAIGYAAALWLGATVTGVDQRLGPTELTQILGRARPVVTVGAEGTRAAEVAAGMGGTPVTRAEMRAAVDGPEAPWATDVGPDSPATISWTSGTTGAAKGAWFTHRALENAAVQSGPLSAPFDRRVFPTPFAHIGFLAKTWDQIAWGITTVLTPRPWSAPAMLELLERDRITVGQGVPLQWEKLLALPGFDDADLSALRIAGTGSSRVPPELVRAMRARLGCPVLVRYACSEVPVACGTAPDDPPEVAAETIGRPAPGVETRIVDESGAAVAPGAVGRLLLRSIGAMSGYWDDPGATAAALDPDGWIDVGDVARTTDRGDLVMLGRGADTYIRGGYNVHPLEVERILMAHPRVDSAAVIGLAAPVVGQVGMAFVVPAAGTVEDGLAEELTRWCTEQLADYKTPERIEIVTDLPRNAMSKVDKKALRRAAENRTTSS